MADQAQAGSELLELTAEIVSAHVSNNSVPLSDLPGLIQEVYRTLSNVGREPAQPDRPQPVVPVKRSIHADYLVCLLDGKKLITWKLAPCCTPAVEEPPPPEQPQRPPRNVAPSNAQTPNRAECAVDGARERFALVMTGSS